MKPKARKRRSRKPSDSMSSDAPRLAEVTQDVRSKDEPGPVDDPVQKDSELRRKNTIVQVALEKHLARRETMKVILNSVRYRGRSRHLDFDLDPAIVIPGDQELEIMKGQRKQHGKSLC